MVIQFSRTEKTNVKALVNTPGSLVKNHLTIYAKVYLWAVLGF